MAVSSPLSHTTCHDAISPRVLIPRLKPTLLPSLTDPGDTELCLVPKAPSDSAIWSMPHRASGPFGPTSILLGLSPTAPQGMESNPHPPADLLCLSTYYLVCLCGMDWRVHISLYGCVSLLWTQPPIGLVPNRLSFRRRTNEAISENVPLAAATIHLLAGHTRYLQWEGVSLGVGEESSLGRRGQLTGRAPASPCGEPAFLFSALLLHRRNKQNSMRQQTMDIIWHIQSPNPTSQAESPPGRLGAPLPASLLRLSQPLKPSSKLNGRVRMPNSASRDFQLREGSKFVVPTFPDKQGDKDEAP